MSIKGTLETFNLCELLQMLAFNQKEGTLVLDGEGGARAVYLDDGRLAFMEQDAGIASSLARMARYYEVAEEPQLADAEERAATSGRNLAGVLEAMELVPAEQAQALLRDAFLEQLFECQLTAVAGFEFVEGQALNDDGSEGRPIVPPLPVESLLLDLARMLDHWNTVAASVPGAGEIYEGTGIAVDLGENDEIDPHLAETVIPLLDGRRSLEQIARSVHATPHAVMEIAAALFEGGGIRAVPTDDLVRRAEDLLARGEAAATVALFQRCIDRGDAPLDVRLRLADALEASGNAEAAAAELDTFAALSGDENAPVVFDALTRALRLRGGDLATAARTCDYYLRRRPWLQDFRAVAAQALRSLITAATTQGKPVEAALRLQGFVDCGEAPQEDLVLLADLYAAGGARREAADALYKRAEDLLATDRTSPARQMLRRALELDPGHADARRRTMEIDGVRRRRGHRARIALILLALGGVAAGAGVAWFGYRDTASTELVDAQAQAELGFSESEERARKLIAAFEKDARTVETEGRQDEDLGTRAAKMRADVRAIMAAVGEVLTTYTKAIEEAEASGKVVRHRETLDRMQKRRMLVTKQAGELVTALAANARSALAQAHEHHTAGEFEPTRKLLRAAWSLAFHDSTTRADAARTLAIIDEYFKRYEDLRARMDERTKAGDLKGAFAIGLEGVQELYDSDLTRKLAFPVKVTSTPAGAEVWLGAEDTGLRTPCVLPYSPFANEAGENEDARDVDTRVLRLRMGGRTPHVTNLPTFAAMRRDAVHLGSYEPAVTATLPEGPRWTVTDTGRGFRALWAGRDLPLAAGDGGHHIFAVAPRDGHVTAGERIDPTRDGIRLAGRFPDGTIWRVTGHRTLTVRTPDGTDWETITISRIEHPPTLVGDDLLVVVDQGGTVYAYKLANGGPTWRVEMDTQPSQRPYASKLGILVATTTGATHRIDPKTGDAKSLVPGLPGTAIAVPFRDGALVLGGGKGGCRLVDADGAVRVIGDARPGVRSAPWLGAEGCAWIDAAGTVQWLGTDAKAPVPAAGLGRDVERLGGGGGLLFGTSVDGRMRAVSVEAPDQVRWSAPLGGRATTDPLRLGGGVYVLVGRRLVALDA